MKRYLRKEEKKKKGSRKGGGGGQPKYILSVKKHQSFYNITYYVLL